MCILAFAKVDLPVGRHGKILANFLKWSKTIYLRMFFVNFEKSYGVYDFFGVFFVMLNFGFVGFGSFME